MKPKLKFKHAYDTLLNELEKSPSDRPAEVTELPFASIKRMVAVFQPRSLEGNMAEDEQFINELTAALKMRGTRPLDPITVWWSGRNFYVIDGHHRLEAYKRCGDVWRYGRPIPVEELKGTLSEAHEFSIKANSKNRLPMRKEDRLNSAWKLTCLGSYSKSKVAELTGVSERTVATMRRTLKEIIGDEPQDSDDFEAHAGRPDVHDLAGLTWMQAQSYLNGGGHDDDGSWNDNKEEKLAQEFAKRLLRAFGKKISVHPEAFARALVLVNDGIPQKLSETAVWADYTAPEEPDFDEEPEEEIAEF